MESADDSHETTRKGFLLDFSRPRPHNVLATLVLSCMSVGSDSGTTCAGAIRKFKEKPCILSSLQWLSTSIFDLFSDLPYA